MFLILQMLELPITVQLLTSLHLKITVKMVRYISISDKLDTCQHQLLKLSGLLVAHLTLLTLLKQLLMPLLKPLGMHMLLFLKRMPRWMPLLQPFLHLKLQLSLHFQTCLGLQQLTLDILSKLHIKMLLC